MKKIKYLLISCLLVLVSMPTSAKLLHSERSLYRNIFVEERDGKRCMVFGRRSKNPDYQSCILVEDPDQLVFSYTKLVLASFLLNPKPASILVLGLGGGTLPLTLQTVYPEAAIDSVEIDEAVYKVAKKWFMYEETELQKSYIRDGRVFVKQQLRKNKQYDVVILDAFNGDYIPEHMMTEEFLTEIKTLLSTNGLVIANTFSSNKLYDHESVTYQKVFGQLRYIHSKISGNRILLAHKTSNSETKFMPLTDQQMGYLSSIGVDFDDFQQRLQTKPDWDESVRTLTDQFAPANLLNRK